MIELPHKEFKKMDIFHKNDKIEQEYFLKCRASVVSLWVDDAGRKYESKILILVPEMNDQAARFFDAWLPEDADKHYELAGYIRAPIASKARLSIQRRNDRCDKHHLTVMSKGVADEIEKFALDKVLSVEIFPSSRELESLESKETSGDFTKIRELY